MKRPGRGVDHPLPSSAEVKERVQLNLHSPSEPSRPVIGWPYFSTSTLLDKSKYLKLTYFNFHSTLLHTSAGLMIRSVQWLDYRLDQGIGVRLPPETSVFFFGDCRPTQGLAQPPGQRIKRAMSRGVKRLERGTGHLLSLRIEVKTWKHAYPFMKRA